jgi:hypothetical protein
MKYHLITYGWPYDGNREVCFKPGRLQTVLKYFGLTGANLSVGLIPLILMSFTLTASAREALEEIGWVNGECAATHYLLVEPANVPERQWVQSILASLTNRNPFATYRLVYGRGTTWTGPDLETLLKDKNFMRWIGPDLKKMLRRHLELIVKAETDKSSESRNAFWANHAQIIKRLESHARLRVEQEDVDCN